MEKGKLPMAMAYIPNMIRAKMGRASTRSVTTRSILSDNDRECLGAFFCTALRITDSM